MFDSSGHFTNKSVKYIEQQLKPTYKDCIPNDNDKRVAGMLMRWVLQHSGEDVPQAELKSFRNYSQITVARVPKMYDVEVNARLTQARTKRCSEMKVLSDYLFQTATFMHDGIDHVKKEMKRKLKSSAATRRTAPRREDGDDTIVEEEQYAGGAISDLASIINAEVALHPELYLTEEDQESSGAQPIKVSKEDTMIHICTERNCKKLRLKLALDIHRYESHQILPPIIGDSNAGSESS